MHTAFLQQSGLLIKESMKAMNAVIFLRCSFSCCIKGICRFYNDPL